MAAPDQTASLADQAYGQVLDLILHRKVAGGAQLVEGRLTESLGLTRTPLREALVRLEGEGLLVKQANRSFSVRQVTAREFFQSLKVRQYLEAKAAVLAIGRTDGSQIKDLRRQIRALATVPAQDPEHWRVDDALHGWLAELSGNAVLTETIRRLRLTTQLFEAGPGFDRVARNTIEHLAILDALSENDPEAADAAILAHLKGIETDVLKVVSGR